MVPLSPKSRIYCVVIVGCKAMVTPTRFRSAISIRIPHRISRLLQVVCDVASTAAGVAGGIAGSTVGAAQGQSIGSWLGEQVDHISVLSVSLFWQVGWESAGSAAGLVIGGILGGLAGHTTANSVKLCVVEWHTDCECPQVATYALNSFFSLGPKHALHDCYELLEVSRESTVQELTKAYRRHVYMGAHHTCHLLTRRE